MDQNKGKHVVLGVAVRADFSAERHTPTLFPFLTNSCSTELVVGLQCQQDRDVTSTPSGLSNGPNARALDPILQVSLSSSRCLTPFVGGAIGLVFSLHLGGTHCRIWFWPRSQERFWSSCHHLLSDGITHAIVFCV